MRTGWIVVVALAGGCRKPRDPEPDISVRVNEPIPEPKPVREDASPVAPVPGTPDPSPGSRDVPGERGVPLDRTSLGSFAHPFGALEVIKPTSTRDDILVAITRK